MSDSKEFTIFFVKPPFYVMRKKIYNAFFERLVLGDHIEWRGQPRTVADFYREFYADVEAKNPDGFNVMVEKYPRTSGGLIDLARISGEGIVQRVKEIVGPTRYEDNFGKNTLREQFGPFVLPNTVVHASTPEEVERDIEILIKYNLMPEYRD